MDKKDFDKQITEQAEFGISVVGPQKALEAALLAQTAMTRNLLVLINGMVKNAEAKGIAPVLPLTDEVLDLHNNVVGACALTGAVLKLGKLPEHHVPEFDHSTTPYTRH